MIAAVILRDLRRAIGGGAWLPIAFFLLVATLFPLAIGPDAAVLARVGGGVVWTAALLAALLPVERLVAEDVELGLIEQWVVRRQSLAGLAAAKLAAHWLSFGPPLMFAVLPASALLGLGGEAVARIELTLLIGTPALAALGLGAAALLAGVRGGGALAALLVLPLAVPLLIFATGALAGALGALKLLAAVSLVFVAGVPPLAGAALRATLD